MINVGEKIEKLRKEKGLSRPVFCGDESALSVRQLARIEKGEFHPTLKTLEYIAERLEVPSYILMPDYKEPPKRYLELKYLLLHHPDYGNQDLMDQKEAYFDEIFEDFYDDLPRDEQMVVDCLQAIDEVRLTCDARYGQGVLQEDFNTVYAKEFFTANDLLKLRLYFLCHLMDGMIAGAITESNQEQIKLFFKKLCRQIDEANLEDLPLLRDALFASLCCLEIMNDLDLFDIAVTKLNDIVEKTRDFQKKPIILMVEWKYYIQSDFNQANQKYQEAKMMAQMLGNEHLVGKLDEEWKQDIKKYL